MLEERVIALETKLREILERLPPKEPKEPEPEIEVEDAPSQKDSRRDSSGD